MLVEILPLVCGFVPVQGPGGVVPVASMARMSHCEYAARS